MSRSSSSSKSIIYDSMRIGSRSRLWHLTFFLIASICCSAQVARNADNHSSVFPATSYSSSNVLSFHPFSYISSQVMIPLYGNHTWTIHSTDGAYQGIQAKVPGDILSDLYRNNLIAYPFFDNHFLTQRHVWMGSSKRKDPTPESHCSQQVLNVDQLGTEYDIPSLEQRTRTWVYSTEFHMNSFHSLSNDNASTLRYLKPLSESAVKSYALVVEGIKMGASIYINGVYMGNTTNQFLRYIFIISESHLHFNSTNYMTITFDPQINTRGRFMACSGGWDWAPYSKAAEVSCSSRRVLTFGIVRPIYLIQVEHVVIVHFVPKISYLGDENIPYLLDGKDFELIIDVHLQLFEGYDLHTDDDNVIVLRSEFWDEEITQSVASGNYVQEDGNEFLIVTVKTIVPRDGIKLWWPVRYGGQFMYNLQVRYRNQKLGLSSEWVEKRIGFRSVALSTHNESDTSSIPSNSTGKFGMVFKINGIPILARGANVVPVSQLEYEHDNETHIKLVRAAVKARMNMLRVWGGGIIFPQAFYDACDDMGILLYQDLMFVDEQFHGFDNNEEIIREIKYIVRSLVGHPSIVIWNGCNECEIDPSGNYSVNEAMQTVAKEDPTRIVWPNSPSSGWRSGVNALTGLPNGEALIDERIVNPIEIHGPYLHGCSKTFMSVNGHCEEQEIRSTFTPIEISEHSIGVSYPNHFITEFGASTFSSFESMSASLSERHWNLHSLRNDNCTIVFQNLNQCENESEPIIQRNYPCDELMKAYFGAYVHFDSVGKINFQIQLYQCMISQTLWMKSQIEIFRSQNIYGMLVWQLNDQWASGGWGLLDPGNGSRWKPLMHVLRNSLFTDLITTCGEKGKCYARNDGLLMFNGTIVIEKWHFDGSFEILADLLINLGPNGEIEYFTIPYQNSERNTTATVLHIHSFDGIVQSRNVILYNEPFNLKLRKGNISVEFLKIDDETLQLKLHSQNTVFYVFLSTQESGWFDDNAFAMRAETTKIVTFTDEGRKSINMDRFKETFHMEHLASAMLD